MDSFDVISDVLRGLKVKELPEVKQWCSTGSTLMDLAITGKLPGDIPVGRIVQTYGGFSSGKTVIASTVLGAALRSGMLAFYGDVEFTLDPQFAGLYGLDVANENFYWGYDWKADTEVVQPETIEALFDDWIAGIIEKFKDKPKILVVDSLTALPAAIEVEKDMDEKGFGAYRAKQISLGLRKYLNLMVQTNTSLFLIDQTRDNVGAAFGDMEITTGGRAAEFYSSVRIYLQHEARIQNSKEKDIGIWVKFSMKKNKVGKPFRNGSFKIDFDYGLDDVHSNLRFLADVQSNKKSEGMKKTAMVELEIPGPDGKPVKEKKTIKAWIPYVEEHKLHSFLQGNVWTAWNSVYEDREERPPRQWGESENGQ